MKHLSPIISTDDGTTMALNALLENGFPSIRFNRELDWITTDKSDLQR
jgi:hypothetical protein